MTQIPASFDTVAEIMNAARDHFFDPSSMKAFSSRILEGVYHGRYFITSERPPHGLRTYSIRMINAEGRIQTVHPHTGYSSARAAQRVAERLNGAEDE